MAPIILEPEIRYQSVATAVGHVAIAIWLSAKVARDLHNSRRDLSPAQDTRNRISQRSKNLPIFITLAVVSLAWAVYMSAQYAALSYRVWATDRNIRVPTRTYGKGGFLDTEDNTHLRNIGRWLTETPVYLDAVEILTEKTRRLWWAQQLDLGMISWSMLLAIEGRRRNIPLLWCYQLLAQLVSLPYAQNLFFIALLLTPSPRPERDGGRASTSGLRSKPSAWTPHASAYLAILLLNLGINAGAPLFVNTPTFVRLITASRALTLAPVLLPYILPSALGSVQKHPHDMYSAYTSLFRTIWLCSLALHGRATMVGLAYNAPDAQFHRHSIHLPFDVEQRSAWDRTTSAFGRILTATSDHPVVRQFAWDVLLSALSIGLWASTRATDVLHIISPASQHDHHQEEQHGESPAETKAVTKRGKQKAITAAEDQFTETKTPRRRGRPRAVKADPEEAEDDGTYQPTPSEIADAAEGDVLPDADEAGWESAALAWGLTALGGLGTGSAAVFGGECIAR